MPDKDIKGEEKIVEETVNETPDTEKTVEEKNIGKTFTQSELNAIVNKEKRKLEEKLEGKKTLEEQVKDLQKFKITQEVIAEEREAQERLSKQNQVSKIIEAKVSPKNIDRFKKLVEIDLDGNYDNVDEVIDNLLKEYPVFLKGNNKDFIDATKNEVEIKDEEEEEKPNADKGKVYWAHGDKALTQEEYKKLAAPLKSSINDYLIE